MQNDYLRQKQKIIVTGKTFIENDLADLWNLQYSNS